MDKLANGISPIDDTMAPDDDLINNVRLSRCFFFVSDVLRQVIENGGTKSAVNKKLKKLPLEIPMEKRSQFAYSEVPIPASEIAKRINALADNDTMQKLPIQEFSHGSRKLERWNGRSHQTESARKGQRKLAKKPAFPWKNERAATDPIRLSFTTMPRSILS